MIVISLFAASCGKVSILLRRTRSTAGPRLRCGQRTVLAAFLLLAFGAAHRAVAQATITVNTTQPGVTNGQCSLQEAIYATEFKSNTAIGATSPDSYYTTGCIAGTGNGDTIVLPAGAVFTFDVFWDGDAHNKFGPTATPVIFSTITIEGNGATLQWTGPGYSRLFTLATVTDADFGSGTGNLTLRNVYVKGFRIKGGDGGLIGGGGGLGAGGAIFVQGQLTVESSTFDGNGAIGGNGNHCSAGFDECFTNGPAGGGGGGFSGNGGDASTYGGGGGVGRVAAVAAEGTLLRRRSMAGVEAEVAPFLMVRMAKARPEETADFSVAGVEGMLGLTPKARPARVAAVAAAAVSRTAVYFQPAGEMEVPVTSAGVAGVARVMVATGASVAVAAPVTVETLLCLVETEGSAAVAALPPRLVVVLA